MTLPDADAVTPQFATLPPLAHAFITAALIIIGVLAFHGIWRLLESPAVRHFFHGTDPLCSRCWRRRALRAEKKRHREMIRELRQRQEARRG